MLAGLFALAATVKSRQTQLPLWSLMLAASLLDIVFLVLYFAGIEKMVPVEGTSGYYGDMVAANMDWSHSLVSALVISLIAAVVTMLFWGRRNGLIIGAVVFSHWFLDFVVHRADLAILPGNANNLPRIGLGLWQWPWVAAIIELALVLVGAYLYYHAAMQSAVLAERQESRERGELPGYSAPARPAAGVSAPGYRQHALVAALVMAILLVVTLLANLLVPFSL
jgi:hypothetical protein